MSDQAVTPPSRTGPWPDGEEFASAVDAELAAATSNPRLRDLGEAQVDAQLSQPLNSAFRVDIRGSR